MEARPRILKDYQTADGRFPFREWWNEYEGQKIFDIIDARLQRVKKGLMGDCEPVGGGVLELKIDWGPGFRVYFGEDGTDIILLTGGTKKSQTQDIRKAREFWDDYNA